MIETYFVLICAIIGNLTAQLIKPFANYIVTGKWNVGLFVSAGNFPSAHSATVFALTTAVALKEGLDSTYFAIALSVAVLIAYDAMNVRYYAGQNIQVTKQLVLDLQSLSPFNFKSPIYLDKMKDVLGHKKFEVASGAILGILIPFVIMRLFL